MIIAGIGAIPLRSRSRPEPNRCFRWAIALAGCGLVARQGHDGSGIGRVGRGLRVSSSRFRQARRRPTDCAAFASAKTRRIEPLMLDVQKKLHVFGRAGALAFGISAVDIALWMFAGKAANMPLSGFSGAARPICPVMQAWSAIPTFPCALQRAAGAQRRLRCLKLHEIELSAFAQPRGSGARHRADPRCQLSWDVERGAPHRGGAQGSSFEMAGGATLASGEF